MEKVLVTGVNTRAVACSLKKLGYTVYSADYFGVMDLKPCVNGYKSFLDQTPGESCGKFTDTFHMENILQLAEEYVSSVDLIICLSGVSPKHFPKRKLQGNYQVDGIDDKYRLYQKFKNKFQYPATFKVCSIEEAQEIAENYQDKSFILKPRSGSGGYGIFEYSEGVMDNKDLLEMDYILQEKIHGLNLSASVLSTGTECEAIITSRQIIGDKTLNPGELYGYCGNITPYTDKNVNDELNNTSEEIIRQLKLVGSNGVDYILNEDGLHIIEVNPRLQGTLECAELSLNINMAQAHLEACQGNLIEIPSPERTAVKMIVHAPERSQVANLDLPGVYDLPYQGVIIEKGEPLATVIISGLVREDTIYLVKKMVQRIYRTIKPKI